MALCAKYKFKQDFSANGTNIAPPSSGLPLLRLKYNFKKGDIFDGNKSSEASVTIETPNALNINGTSFGGRARFGIPLDILECATSDGNTNKDKSFFTPKNIIIGLLAIGVIFGGLKLAKVI